MWELKTTPIFGAFFRGTAIEKTRKEHDVFAHVLHIATSFELDTIFLRRRFDLLASSEGFWGGVDSALGSATEVLQ
jgi:hypothetical protein